MHYHLGDVAAVGDGAHHVGTEQQFHARIARQPLQHERQDGVVVGVVLALQRSAPLHLPARLLADGAGGRHRLDHVVEHASISDGSAETVAEVAHAAGGAHAAKLRLPLHQQRLQARTSGRAGGTEPRHAAAGHHQLVLAGHRHLAPVRYFLFAAHLHSCSYGPHPAVTGTTAKPDVGIAR